MRVAVFFLVALVVAASAKPLLMEEEYQALFQNYQTKFDKQYADEKEFFARYEIYKENFDKVLQHNQRADAGEFSFRVGMNQHADMTNAEYRQKMLGLKRSPLNAPHRPAVVGRHRSVDISAAPTSWDWRDHGAVNPIKNQAQCGSCWAFSATAAMEGAYFQQYNTLKSFSEQLLVDCVNGGADTCDLGGEMHDGYLFVIQNGGEVDEASYPYTATSGGGCKASSNKPIVTNFNGYLNVTQGDENALLVASAAHVISVGIDASQWTFQLYSSGVYNEPNCKNGWADLDHGVAVVGYGSLNGTPYWIVRNSWGNWGMSGYILMTRSTSAGAGSNQCGIATDATYPTWNKRV